MASTEAVRRIVVVTQMHTDERGDEVNDLLRDFQMPGVDLVTREVPAWARTRRGLDCNPATRASGNSTGNRDDRFLNEVYQVSRTADLVIDVHFNPNPWSFPFMGELTWLGYPLARLVAAELGSDWILVNRGGHPAAFVHRYLGFDLGTESQFLDGFVELLQRLAGGWEPTVEQPLIPYRFVGDVHAEQAEALGLRREYAELELLPDELAWELDRDPPVYAALWAPNPERGDCWGEVVAPYVEPVRKRKRRRSNRWGVLV